MFERLSRLANGRPRTVVLVTLVLVALALVYGKDVADLLLTGGQTEPSSSSTEATQLLDQRFHSGQPNLVLLVKAPEGIDAPDVAAEGRALTKQLAAEPVMEDVGSWWTTGLDEMRSRDGHQAVIVGHIRGSELRVDDELDALLPHYRGAHGPVQVLAGGSAEVRHQVESTVRADIKRAEGIGIPLTALVLILVFRSFVAALLPLLVGVIAVIGTNASLKVISHFTDVSIFSLNLATGLSLGLAADYGLFVVRRYREELRRGADTETAIRITLSTAGRTVAFSSLTVVAAMLSMLVFPMYFLRSFAYAGVSVVVLAALAALVALPAGLVVLGRFVDALDFTKAFTAVFRRIRPRRGPVVPREPGYGWRRIAEVVMRHAVAFTVGSTAILVLLGIPFLHVHFGLPDDRHLPKSFESHVVVQALRDDFAAKPTERLDVVLTGVDGARGKAAATSYAAAVSKVDGVTQVDGPTGTFRAGEQVAPATPQSARFQAGDAWHLQLSSDTEPISGQGVDLVHRIRAVPAPTTAYVGGQAADLADARASMLGRLPWALGLIALTTLVLLFLLTGSVLIPFKALAMNMLSLSATFGALVWIFQDYHLSGLLSFQRTTSVDVTLLMLLFCVAFGVSMDYEVFLLSRIKEEYVRHRDNRKAVAYGIEKTGGVVTAAALITSIVFTAMASSRVTNIKMFGLGLALAMLMDASIVRTLLVPSLMRLAGRANWWAPAPLRRVYDRFGISEGELSIELREPAGAGTPVQRGPRRDAATPLH